MCLGAHVESEDSFQGSVLSSHYVKLGSKGLGSKCL